MAKRKINNEEKDAEKNPSQPKLKKISIETKMEVLRRVDNGESNAAIGTSMNLHEATVRTIKRNRERITKIAECISSNSMQKISRCRPPIIHKTETLLYAWITDQRKKGFPLSSLVIQEKAKSLFQNIKTNEQAEHITSIDFIASKGWLENFKKRFNLRNVHLQQEADADPEEFVEYHDDVLIKMEFDSFEEILQAEEQRKESATTGIQEKEQHKKEENKQKLSLILKKANELNQAVSKFEEDKKRSNAFAATVNGAVSYYAELFNELNNCV